jgi:hypothetical protein
MIQHNLGFALLTLGEHTPGTAHLEESIRTYRAALLEICDRPQLLYAAHLQQQVCADGEIVNGECRNSFVPTAR